MGYRLARLVAKAAKLAGATGGMLFLPRAEAALAIAPFGTMRGSEGLRKPPPGSALAEALRTGEPRAVEGLSDVAPHLRERAQALGAAAVLHVPVRGPSGRLLAVLSLSSPAEGPLREPSGTRAVAAEIGRVLEEMPDRDLHAIEHDAETMSAARRFRAFMDAMPATAWIKDHEGRYLLMNARVERLWDVREADLLGKTDFDFLPAAVAEAIRANDAVVQREGRAIEIEERVPTADGEERTWLATKFPLRMADGVAVAGVAFDVTPLKRAEARSARREADLQTLLEGLGDGVIINQDGRFAYANQAAAAMFGAASGAALVGVSIEELIAEEGLDELRHDVARALGGEPVMATRSVRRLDGSPFVLEAQATLIEYRGRAALAVILRDVTARKAREEQVQLASRLASLGTLAAAVGHEINNPLMFVTTNLDLLDEQLRLLRPAMTSGKRAEIDEMIADAREGASRIQRIVRAIKVLGRTADQPRPLSLEGPARTALDLVTNELRHRARVELDLRPTPLVSADETRLCQILVALLTNASQAIEPGRVDAHTVRLVTYTDAAGRAVLEVTDDGAGIPRADLAHVFDPFFTTRPVGMGSGLGLSIVDAVVRALGGEVKIESEVGVGTTARVTFPPVAAKSDGKDATAPTFSTPVAVAKPGRVLVIDDEPAIGRAVERTLRSLAEVVAVRTAGAALDALAHGGFDLVLADLMMPEMDGAELFEAIRTRYPEMTRRVVFMTGGAFSERTRRLLADTDNPRVAKPLGILELKALVAKYLAT